MTEVEKRLIKAGDLATGAIRAENFPKWAKVTSLPDTDTTITHNVGTVPKFVLAVPAYDSGVFGSVATKSYTASTFVAKASVSGVDMYYAVVI